MAPLWARCVSDLPPLLLPPIFLFGPSVRLWLLFEDACTNISVLGGGVACSQDVRSVRGVGYTYGYFSININIIYALCGT